MTFIIDAHKILSNMAGIYSVLLAIWGLVSGLRRIPPDGNYNGALVLAFGLYVVEGLVGVVLSIMGLAPARWIHVLYGVTIVLTLPAVYLLTRGRNSSRESILYGLALLFIWGLTERANDTAVQAGL